jgi:chromosome segregation ATPase
MIDRNGKTVIPFAPGSKANMREDGGPVDESGKAIISLVKEAADTARATCLQAVNAAQKASNQLHAAEDRIKELELEVQHYHDRAAHAEKWLARVHHEIEEKFFGPSPAARSG